MATTLIRPEAARYLGITRRWLAATARCGDGPPVRRTQPAYAMACRRRTRCVAGEPSGPHVGDN